MDNLIRVPEVKMMDEILSEFTGLIRAMGSDIERLANENNALEFRMADLEDEVRE